MNDVVEALGPAVDAAMAEEMAAPPAPAEEEPIEKDRQPDDLAKEWGKRIKKARRHWKRFYERCRHNRKVVQNFDQDADPDSPDFVKDKCNLILGSINTLLPAIYSRNPDIEVKPRQQHFKASLFPKTLETVLGRELEDAQLKLAATEAVRAALTCSYGVVKALYQKDIRTDPVIQKRLEDTQDNLEHQKALLADIEDDPAAADIKAKIAELELTQQGLEAKLEVVASEGLVVDRVLTDNLIIDPTVESFDDYVSANWMAQVIPMERGEAERTYRVKLGQATKYVSDSSGSSTDSGPVATTVNASLDGMSSDAQSTDTICILEIWDKRSQMIYTLAEGCPFFLRDPFPPPVQGRRFYPFFLLPYNKVNGEFVAPSMVDMVEKLSREHNDLCDKLEEHRQMVRPGYVVGNDIKRDDIQSWSEARVGEITQMKGLDSSELQKGIMPKTYPPVDAALYDTTGIRQNWELVTGLQDAARASINKAKTATEAQIMSNSLSARISMFQDWTEEFLTELVQYCAQILLIELDDAKVHRLMGDGDPIVDPATGQQLLDPMTGQPMFEKTYDWPTLSRDDILEQVTVGIRAGSTGKPDKLEEQETWGKILPTLLQLMDKITLCAQQGLDTKPYEELVKETIKRFDDRLDPRDYIPNVQAIREQAQQQALMQQQAAAMQQPVPQQQ